MKTPWRKALCAVLVSVALSVYVPASADELRACPNEHRSPLVMCCIDDYLSGRRLPLDSIYQHPWPLQKG